MGQFWRRDRRGRGGDDDPPCWPEARSFIEECRRLAHPPGQAGPIPPKARRHIFPFLSNADWFQIRLHHHVAQFLEEEGVVAPDDLARAAKANLVGFVAPYILGPDRLAAVAKANPGQAERIARDRAVWEAAQAMGPSRVRPGETVGAALKRHHPDPGLAAAYDTGADDLRSGAWRSGRSLWFLLPYAAARDRGILIETPPPFAALESRTRTALSWMHRAMLSGDDNLRLMADAGGDEDPENPVAVTGMILAEQIYPFQTCAGYLLMDWTIPDPLPRGDQPVSRHCPCDTALSLLRAARNHAVDPPGAP